MFPDEKDIKDIRQLVIEFKKYLNLQKEYTKLKITEKLSLLLSWLLTILLTVVLGMTALFYLTFMLAYMMAPAVGGLIVSFCIVAGIYILLAVLLVIYRKKLIINPMIRFIGGLLLKKTD